MYCNPIRPHPTSTWALCAAAILRAWVAGDTRKVRVEAKHSLILAESEGRDSGDDERLELLRAVSHRLVGCIDDSRFSDTDPQVSLCVSLLGHLARQDSPD